MIGAIIELTEQTRDARLQSGFFVFNTTADQEIKIAVDDCFSIISTNNRTAYTQPFLGALCEHNIPFTICDKNYLPCGMLLSVCGNLELSKHQSAQIAKNSLLAPNLWKQVVSTKIQKQAFVLSQAGIEIRFISAAHTRIGDGDLQNMEAQVARYYWAALFGDQFRRDRKAEGLNTLLNYGYTVLRSAVARSVIGTGLLPSIGIHHHNQYNPFCLVDDLIEPYRPLIDLKVWRLYQENAEVILNSSIKKQLANVLHEPTYQNKTPVHRHMHNLTKSLCAVFLEKGQKLCLPTSP